jgi:glycerol-3-phosphate O-acyltransferase
MSATEVPQPPLPSGPSPEHYRSGMRRRFGLLFHLSGLGILLGRIRMEDHSADQVRRAAERGPVVYVLHSRSVMDWLALNRVLIGRRLPLSRFSNGLRSTAFAPISVALREWWTALQARKQGAVEDNPITSGWLQRLVASGVPTALFLLPGRDLRSTLRAKSRPQPHLDPIPSLLTAQATCARPIQIVPVVVAWHRRPEVARGEVGRFLLGSQDEPTWLQKIFSVGARSSKIFVHAGTPIDLAEITERFQDEPAARQERRLRLLLRRYIYRESHVVRGPRLRSHRWTRRLVMRSPEIRSLITEEAAQSGESSAQVEAKVEATLDKMAARMRFNYVRVTAHILRFLWNRVFSGVDMRPEDLQRLRESFRDATPVLVPSHRSHLDYLLISSHLYHQDIIVPHIVAGENLSFWPLGHIFRSQGAFFIKRRFYGDRIFPVVFARYLHQLIRDGFPIEFFIEGGRSRTGKLLPARLGVLSMILDSAGRHREGWDVNLLPIAISYEQIAEARAYERELSGISKKTENVGQVVKASGGIFRKRFGRVFLRVGEPIRASEVLSTGGKPWAELDEDHRAEILQLTGERLMYRISRNMVMLPTGVAAMALLAQHKSTVSRSVLKARTRRITAALLGQGALPGHPMAEAHWGIDEAIDSLEGEGLVRRVAVDQTVLVQVVGDKRISLEYHKNGSLHFLTPMSLLSAAIRGCRDELGEDGMLGDEGPLNAEISRLFAEQVYWLRYEFTTDPENTLEQLQADAYEGLVRYGALQRGADGALGLGSTEYVRELADLTRNFLESLLLVLQAAPDTATDDAKVLGRRIQEAGRKDVATGKIKHPEALSMANLNNAIRGLREDGTLTLGDELVSVDSALHEAYTRDLHTLLR